MLTFHEPLNDWQNFHGVNLLQQLYQDPHEHSFTFQNFAMITMIKNYLENGKIKIFERSLDATMHVFLRAHEMFGTITNTRKLILLEWYELITYLVPIRMDAIIYIQTSPRTAMKRLKSRNRPEEQHIKLKYLQMINDLYNHWLYNCSCTKIIRINGNQETHEIMNELNEKLGKIE